MENQTEHIKDITVNLLSLMGVRAGVEVSSSEEGYDVHIDTQETGILIGYHGETLSALQLIITQIASRNVDQWPRIIVNVGDYLEKRQAQLRALADRAVEQVKESQTSETLPYLSPRERRYIHLYLQDVAGIKTESVGEGEERRLVIFPTVSKDE